MPASVTLKASGLNTSPNSLDNAEGSLIEANNIIIKRDNIIEARRGFGLFGDSFGTITDRAKQLMTYKQRIIRHFATTLQFQNGINNDGTAKFSDFSGSYSEAQPGRRMRSIEANGNFYFTTSEGIQKISATSGAGLSTANGFITMAGGIKAIDINTRLDITLGNQTGFLPQDSAVAYRVVWGTKDANKNLILGSPSQRSVIYNSLLTLMILDFDNVLKSLDFLNSASSLINNGDYLSTLSLGNTASAVQLYNNLIALASKIDNDLFYADNDGTSGSTEPPFEIDTVSITGTVATITFTNPNTGAVPSQFFTTGDVIFLSGTFTPATTGTLIGSQTITVVDDASWAISFNTTATGGVTIDTTSVIHSGKFRAITQPSIPSVPATNQQLVNLQTYLQSILTALQSLTTETVIASINPGFSLEFNAVTITAGVADIAISAGDPRDFLDVGSFIDLTGFFPTTGTLDGLQQVVSVTATDITFNTTATDPVSLSGTANFKKVITFTDSAAAAFIDTLNLTTTANVFIDITIPSTVTSSYFYQIYRSSITQATGTDVLTLDIFPNDELQLVYEAFPTAAQLASGKIIVEDVTPDTFRGANLYTNPTSGDGILQANDRPPFALDINLFKNTVFYANTRTLQRRSLNFLGISDLIAAAEGGKTPEILISDGTTSNTYYFILGIKQITNIGATGAGLLANSGPGSYFTIYNANDHTQYYVWYQLTDSVDPMISGLTGIKVVVDSGDNSTAIALKTSNVLNTLINDFTSEVSGPSVIVTNVDFGYTSDPTVGTTAFSVGVGTSGKGEKATQETRTVDTVADVAGSLAGTYFTINDIISGNNYYVWYTVSGVGVDPAVANATGINVAIITNDNANTVASKTNTVLQNYPSIFTSTVSTNTLTIINFRYGYSTASTAGTSGFTVTNTIQGALEVLLANNISPSISVDETARSFINVVNDNKQEVVFAYYLSGAQDVPGKMFFEGKILNPNSFYILINSSPIGSGFGKDFSPDINGQFNITSITAANPTVITTSSPHGLLNLDNILISGSDSSPNIDGYWQATVLSDTTFSIPVSVYSPGTVGTMILVSDALSSDDEALGNRIYYSKVSQPEAVPIVNFIDVGAADTNILRIFPLRDSLFVFKEDGLYRISGEIAPFVLNLFNSSFTLLAPDSVDVSNNIIYAWTNQGISTLSESGATPSISRPIDNLVLPLSSSNYTNFRTATWGVGYDSDNSYLAFSVKETTDTKATICYRYSNLTKTWTTFDKTDTCGIVNSFDDKLYLGAGNTNYIEQERKSFDRTDYADKEIIKSLDSGRLIGKNMYFTTTSDVAVGDVVLQTQILDIYDYNVLLEKLDIDPSLTAKNYFSTLEASAGNNMRTKIEALANKLDADPDVSITTYASSIAQKTGVGVTTAIGSGTIVVTQTSHGLLTGRVISTSSTVPELTGDFTVTVLSANTFSIPATLNVTSSFDYVTLDDNFTDIQACYNNIITLLNSDSGVSFSNYDIVTDTTIFESIVTAVNTFTHQLTVDSQLDYIQGPISIFKSIISNFTYAPQTMGDPLGLKHIYESTIMYIDKTFTKATVSFATDLMPEFIDTTFNGEGNGLFGNKLFGTGLFGGVTSSAPFRTYIPRDCQRCRYLLIRHVHNTARERYGVLGITITGNVGQSSRAYR